MTSKKPEQHDGKAGSYRINTETGQRELVHATQPRPPHPAPQAPAEAAKPAAK